MSGDGLGVTVGQQGQESERFAGHRMEASKDNVGRAGTSAAIIATDYGDLLSGLLLLRFCLPNLMGFHLLVKSNAQLHVEGDSGKRSCVLNQVDPQDPALLKHLSLSQISEATNMGRKHGEKPLGANW